MDWSKATPIKKINTRSNKKAKAINPSKRRGNAYVDKVVKEIKPEVIIAGYKKVYQHCEGECDCTRTHYLKEEYIICMYCNKGYKVPTHNTMFTGSALLVPKILKIRNEFIFF